MTKRDFFRIIIKIFGLYSVVAALFFYLPKSLPFLINLQFDPKEIILLIVSAGFPVFLFILLLYNTDRVIKLFKLEKGFDTETINFADLNARQLILFSCILIGGLMILDNLTNFIGASLAGFADLVRPKYPISDEPFDTGVNYFPNWLHTGLNILIGYLLIDFRNGIASQLLRNRAPQQSHDVIDQSPD